MDKALRVEWEDALHGRQRRLRFSVWLEDTLHWWKTGGVNDSLCDWA
jgi:hypothetical protein